ncbi:aromatic acid decarboxylase, partial [Candidatus Micrarchaeota archaeon]|nr:aromatic acid decarboxylase [Candidatus Micrarchaeota archaeon]
MKILLAITGASGVIYGKRLYEKIKRLGHNIKLIISENAKTVA